MSKAIQATFIETVKETERENQKLNSQIAAVNQVFAELLVTLEDGIKKTIEKLQEGGASLVIID
jgi:hypothetical protein